MPTHNATTIVGSMKVESILAGNHPHIFGPALKTDADQVIAVGHLLAQDAAGTVHLYGTEQTSTIGTGDAVEAVFEAALGEVEPGTVSVTDGTETFSDDGFGTLTGDAGGSGAVDYRDGRIKVSFNAAPAAAASVAATRTHVLSAVATMESAAGAVDVEICIHGGVVRSKLVTGAEKAAATADQLRALDLKHIYPLG